MAISDFDELNNLKTIESVEKENKKERGIGSYKTFFGEMDISDEEKSEREELAEKLQVLFLFYFLMVQMDAQSDYKGLIEESYTSIANSFTGENTASAYITERASEVAEFVDEITRKHLDDEYYTSLDRGMLLSANEGNVIGNYREFVRAVKAGKTRKKWIAHLDNRVRKTHRQANGQEVGIFEQFTVGKAKMRFCCDESCGYPEEIISCRCVTKYF